MLTALHVKANGEIEKVRASKKLPLWSELPEGEDYICIHCGERVILRKNYLEGYKIPHFAHKGNGENCRLWEPESEEHMILKGMVADIFSSFADYVEIEKRDGIFSKEYYPDIYVEWNGRKIAVEIQCSNKPTKDIIEKTEWYSKHGIYTLWLWKFPTEAISWNSKKTSAQERLMIEWYGCIPYIHTNGRLYLAFPVGQKLGTKTIFEMDLLDLPFSWFTFTNYFDFKKGDLKLFNITKEPTEAQWLKDFFDRVDMVSYVLAIPRIEKLMGKTFKLINYKVYYGTSRILGVPYFAVLETDKGVYVAFQKSISSQIWINGDKYLGKTVTLEIQEPENVGILKWVKPRRDNFSLSLKVVNS